MGKGGGSAPAAPDPAKTAAAQTATNKETAYWNAVLNNVNQVTPYGNLTYNQSGGGKTYNTDAYNQALAAWNSAPPTSTATPFTGDIHNQEQIRQWQNSQKNTTRGAMPKLEDFFTGETPPQFTSTINLSPEQQAIYDSQTRSQQALSTLGEQQLGRIGESVSSPYSFSGLPQMYGADDVGNFATNAENAIYSRLNPQFDRDQAAAESRLVNQGVLPGSEAYNKEMQRLNEAKNDARMQAVLYGQQYGSNLLGNSQTIRNQAINEYNTQRQAPLNEYIGMTSGVQVQNPQFQSQGYQGAQPVDYASLVNQQYQGQLGQYNAKVAQGNSTQNALFSLGGQAAGSWLGSAGGASWLAALSDARLKENLNLEGYTPGGVKVYSYNFIGSDTRETGVLAQEVELTHPDAVIEGPDGFKRVLYHEVP